MFQQYLFNLSNLNCSLNSCFVREFLWDKSYLPVLLKNNSLQFFQQILTRFLLLLGFDRARQSLILCVNLLVDFS